jgi:predicted enzyme related to lactoylglutathione lyase
MSRAKKFYEAVFKKTLSELPNPSPEDFTEYDWPAFDETT